MVMLLFDVPGQYINNGFSVSYTGYKTFTDSFIKGTSAKNYSYDIDMEEDTADLSDWGEEPTELRFHESFTK